MTYTVDQAIDAHASPQSNMQQSRPPSPVFATNYVSYETPDEEGDVPSQARYDFHRPINTGYVYSGYTSRTHDEEDRPRASPVHGTITITRKDSDSDEVTGPTIYARVVSSPRTWPSYREWHTWRDDSEPNSDGVVPEELRTLTGPWVRSPDDENQPPQVTPEQSESEYETYPSLPLRRAFSFISDGLSTRATPPSSPLPSLDTLELDDEAMEVDPTPARKLFQYAEFDL